MYETAFRDLPFFLEEFSTGTVIVGSPHHLPPALIYQIAKGIQRICPFDCKDRFGGIPTIQECRRQIQASLIVIGSHTGTLHDQLAFFGQILPFPEVEDAVEVAAIRDRNLASTGHPSVIVEGLRKLMTIAMQASLIRALVQEGNAGLENLMISLRFNPSGHPNEWWLPISEDAPINRSHLQFHERNA